jgi:hypothetical protein
VARFEPPGPGAVLLCSDGLWNYQPEAVKLAEQALPGALGDPLGAAADLVRFALECGGMDNVTVVLVPFPLKPAHSADPADPARPADHDPTRPADLTRPADPAHHAQPAHPRSHDEPAAPSAPSDPEEKAADEPA